VLGAVERGLATQCNPRLVRSLMDISSEPVTWSDRREPRAIRVAPARGQLRRATSHCPREERNSEPKSGSWF